MCRISAGNKSEVSNEKRHYSDATFTVIQTSVQVMKTLLAALQNICLYVNNNYFVFTVLSLKFATLLLIQIPRKIKLYKP